MRGLRAMQNPLLCRVRMARGSLSNPPERISSGFPIRIAPAIWIHATHLPVVDDRKNRVRNFNESPPFHDDGTMARNQTNTVLVLLRNVGYVDSLENGLTRNRFRRIGITVFGEANGNSNRHLLSSRPKEKANRRMLDECSRRYTSRSDSPL